MNIFPVPDYLLDAINTKKKELVQAEHFFNRCAPEDFEMANTRLTLIRMELSALYKAAREA